MENLICDFYSSQIYIHNTEPVFSNYYNIEFKEGFVMDEHKHGRIEVMYVKKGSCKVIALKKAYRLEAGDLIFLNGNISHRLYVDKNLSCRIVCLEFGFRRREDAAGLMIYAYQKTKDMRSFIEEKNNVIKLKDINSIYDNIIEIYKELEKSGFGKEIIIQTALCEFTIKLARLVNESKKQKGDDVNSYVSEALSYMSSRYSEDISIEMVAKHVNLNASYFYKIFKQVMGKTPSEHLNSLRIKKSKMLLESTDILINDICIYSGFNSRQYFSYVFKKYTGMTPKQFRTQILTDEKKDKMNDSCFGMYQ